MRLTIRPIYFYLLGFCLFLLAVSLVLQFYFKLDPCPLCIIDRILVFILTLFFTIALIHNPKHRGQQVYGLIGFLIAALGIYSTLRHLWILHLPADKVPDCSPGFEYLFKTLAPHEALMMILKGSGECAVKNNLIGLSIPGWTLIGFVFLAIGCLLPCWGRDKP